MTNKRLLTNEEIIKAATSLIRGTDVEAHLNKYRPVAKAQDTKTLKKVGEWLQSVSDNCGDLRTFERAILPGIEALKRGEMPE